MKVRIWGSGGTAPLIFNLVTICWDQPNVWASLPIKSVNLLQFVDDIRWRPVHTLCPYSLTPRVLEGTFKGWVKVQFNFQNSQKFSICRTPKNSLSTCKDNSRSANTSTMAITVFPVGMNTLQFCEVATVVRFKNVTFCLPLKQASKPGVGVIWANPLGGGFYV